MSGGMASRAQLEDLHRLLVENCIDSMDPKTRVRKPGVDLLGAVGALCRQENVKAYLVDQRRVRQINKLFGLYLGALIEAIDLNQASASHLAEAGTMLRAAGIHGPEDINTPRISAADGLKKLASVKLPFSD